MVKAQDKSSSISSYSDVKRVGQMYSDQLVIYTWSTKGHAIAETYLGSSQNCFDFTVYNDLCKLKNLKPADPKWLERFIGFAEGRGNWENSWGRPSFEISCSKL